MKINLLIINGWGFNQSIFNKLEKQLDFEYEIKFIDPSLKDNNLDNKRLYSLIKRNTVIVTWSLGFAFFFERLYPYDNKDLQDKILAIIAISPSPCFLNNSNYINGWDKKIVDRMIYKLHINYNSVLSDFLINSTFHSKSMEKMSKYLIATNNLTINNLSNSLLELSKIDLTNKIKDICCDMLIIHGKDDKIISSKNSIWISNHIRNSSLKLINNCGHIPHFEESKHTANFINNFCEQIRSKYDR